MSEKPKDDTKNISISAAIVQYLALACLLVNVAVFAVKLVKGEGFDHSRLTLAFWQFTAYMSSSTIRSMAKRL